MNNIEFTPLNPKTQAKKSNEYIAGVIDLIGIGHREDVPSDICAATA